MFTTEPTCSTGRSGVRREGVRDGKRALRLVYTCVTSHSGCAAAQGDSGSPLECGPTLLHVLASCVRRIPGAGEPQRNTTPDPAPAPPPAPAALHRRLLPLLRARRAGGGPVPLRRCHAGRAGLGGPALADGEGPLAPRPPPRPAALRAAVPGGRQLCAAAARWVLSHAAPGVGEARACSSRLLPCRAAAKWEWLASSHWTCHATAPQGMEQHAQYGTAQRLLPASCIQASAVFHSRRARPLLAAAGTLAPRSLFQ